MVLGFLSQQTSRAAEDDQETESEWTGVGAEMKLISILAEGRGGDSAQSAGEKSAGTRRWPHPVSQPDAHCSAHHLTGGLSGETWGWAPPAGRRLANPERSPGGSGGIHVRGPRPPPHPQLAHGADATQTPSVTSEKGENLQPKPNSPDLDFL